MNLKQKSFKFLSGFGPKISGAVLLVLSLVFLFLIFPLPAQAGIVFGLVSLIPGAIIGFALGVAIIISSLFAVIMGAILEWVISPGFVSFSYTNPDNNPIIQLGLNVTQSFVNMGLVVILVYIALSIALRLGETDAKKIFAKLIVIALLVNFAPVIVGLIVDASNIVMYTFLEPLQGGISAAVTQSLGDALSTAGGLVSLGANIQEKAGMIMKGVAQIALGFTIGFAFFLFAGLFILRYVAIWVLVILSPLAFVFWVLPATKTLWDKWWNQLIQWSIIGIPMAFFLYLAIASYNLLSQSFTANLAVTEVSSSVVGFFDETFPFVIVIVFLILGFVVGLSTSAMGASAIIKGGKAAGMVAGKTGAKAGWKAAKASGRLAGRAAVRPAKDLSSVYNVSRSLGRGRLQAAGDAIEGVGAAYWASRKNVGQAIGRGAKAIKETVTTKKGAKRAAGGAWRGAKASGRAAWPVVKRTSAGIGSALGDIAQAGITAGAPEVAKALGITEKKKKERPTCTKCGNFVPANAKHCPHCGTAMPLCPNRKCRKAAVPGAAFCASCGTKLPKLPKLP